MKSKHLTTTDADQWRNCEGEIRNVVHHLRWRRRAGRIRTVSLFALLAVVALGGRYFRSVVATELAIEATGSPCDHYMEEMRAFYCEKKPVELEPKLWEHLAHCRDCSHDFVFFGGIAPHARHATATTHDGHAHLRGASSTTTMLELLTQDPTLAVRP